MRVFENRVLRRILARKPDKAKGGWRKLQNAELHDLYPSSNIITMIKSRRVRWAENIACIGKMKNAYKMIRLPQDKRPLGGPRRR
jgi:hypothetical protein